MDTELTGTRMAAAFLTPELESAASDAELNYILFQHDASLISEASVRRDFAAVLQGIGRVLADLSVKSMGHLDLKDDLKKQQNLFAGRNDRAIRDYWQNRLHDLGAKLSCNFQDWNEVSKHLANIERFLDSIRYASGRETLGKSFTCWCAVPLLGRSCSTAQEHLQWMRSALAKMADLPERFDELRDTRNEDKSVRRSESAMPLSQFRSGVYAMWRALGHDWR